MTMMKRLARLLEGRLGSFIAGVLATVIAVWGYALLHPSATLRNLYEPGEKYEFINPLLTCADTEYNPLEAGKSRELHDRVAELVKRLEADGSVIDAGVYFRELHDGPWFGVNEGESFTPGSLLKVPLAMSVYSAAEDDPALLDRSISYTGAPSPEEYFKAPVIEPGKSYTIRELVRATIANSDNNAAYLLAETVGMDALDDTYAHLGIESPVSGSDYSTNVRAYASFFRVLYTATYLDRSASEELLSILSESAFTQGIVAGVPKNITVAHKFGERSLGNSDINQLHDCGIVYVPGNPYLLCVMMRGRDFDTLAKSIAQVSSLVYNYAD